MRYYSHVLHCWHGGQWQKQFIITAHSNVCNAASLVSSCMMYTSIKESSTSVMLKLSNSQTLWWVFYQTKKSSRLNTLHRTSAQQQRVSYTMSLLQPPSHFEQVEGFWSLTLCHKAKKKYILLSEISSLTRNKDLLLTTGCFSSLSEYKNKVWVR